MCVCVCVRESVCASGVYIFTGANRYFSKVGFVARLLSKFASNLTFQKLRNSTGHEQAEIDRGIEVKN